MEMPETLDLTILDASPLKEALLLGRCDSDIAVARLPFGNELPELGRFRDRIDRALRGMEKRPGVDELTSYGHKLFGFCIRGDLIQLYNRLPADHVRIHILSNQPEVRAMPWEYLQEPNHNPGPRRDRSVVRIVPMIRPASPRSTPIDSTAPRIICVRRTYRPRVS